MSGKLPKRWIKRDDLGRGAIVNYIYGGFKDSIGFSTSQFYNFQSDQQPAEENVQNLMPFNGRVKQMWIFANTNNMDADRVQTLRINGTPTTLTVTIPAGQTGVFKSTRQSIEFIAGDLASLLIPAAGTVGAVNWIGTVEIEYDA